MLALAASTLALATRPPMPLRRVDSQSIRAASPRLELGLQVDPLATTSSVFVLGSFALLQLKIRSAEAARGERDKSIETLRKAEVLLLAGKLTADDLAVCRAEAEEQVAKYDEARQIAVLPGALLRVPDPSRDVVARVLNKSADAPTPSPPPSSTASPSADGLDPIRDAMGLRRQGADVGSDGSLLPTGSRTVTAKDVAIGIALALQIAWFLVSLTDPLGTPTPILNATDRVSSPLTVTPPPL